jgi:hypothetical protein
MVIDPLLESEYLALLEAEDYDRAEKSLSHFIKAAWAILEPTTPYLHNWHIDAICEHLEAVKMGQIRKLIVNMPPRHMKSIAITVCFPTWLWIQDPAKRFICASYSARLRRSTIWTAGRSFSRHGFSARGRIGSPWQAIKTKRRCF